MTAERADHDRARLNAAVKAEDGFFTTYFVSPYSKYVARWAAGRGVTPNAVTIVSLLLGLAAAGGFAVGTRAGLVAGAVLLQVSFTADVVDGQLARYTRTFSDFGAWLDATFDRAKEYAVFAGLAYGGTRAGDDGLWVLAGLALALQVVRHTTLFSFVSVNGQGEGAALAASFERRPLLKWLKRIIVLPIGERLALISVLAIVTEPRVVFLALLAWGLVALAYTAAGRLVRSFA